MVEPRITRDRDEIETWADEHDAIPVREGNDVRLVRERDVTTDHERLDWDTFHREVGDEDRVVTYYGDEGDREPFEIGRRDDALDRVASESEEFDRGEAEERLIEGETITGTIAETTVVEETIVEEATIESEVVDRETVEDNVVDVRLLDRECGTCDVLGEDADFDYLGAYGADRFRTDDVEYGTAEQYDEYPFDVSVEVREDWAVTIEQVDRYTVETAITDVNVSETDQVEGRDLEAEIDVDSVHQQLLDSDVIDIDADVDVREGDIVDTEMYDIESEFTEDDVLITYLTSRRQFEREISERSRLTADVVESELLDREITGEETVDAGLDGRETYETEGVTADDDVEYETEGMTADDDLEYETEADEFRVLPEREDEGKPVINAAGDQIGEVIDVDDGVAYVDSHPSLTKKVMSKLGMDEDDDTYMLRGDRIERITDDEVVVASGVFDDDEFDENT